MKNVLVLGGTGLLGHMVYDVLSEEGQVAVRYTARPPAPGSLYPHMESGMGRQNAIENSVNQRENPHDPLFLDVDADMTRLKDICSKTKWDYIINCIGINATDINERDYRSVSRAISVNSVFPRYLAELSRLMGPRVIHISTDGVFSGKSGSYREDSSQDCNDVYGRTKSLGEVASQGFLNIRCSIIGPDARKRRGLLEWFLSLPEGTEVQGYVDYLWNGVTTVQFAEMCKKLILEDGFSNLLTESHVHHFCPNESVTKYALLAIFKKVFSRNVRLIPSSNPGGSVNRILVTQYCGLKSLFGSAIPMEKAVNDVFQVMSRRPTEPSMSMT